jgi:hypothetical protein
VSGATDLTEILRALRVERRPEEVTVLTVPDGTAPALGVGVLALVAEAEGTTVVATVAEAERRGWPVDFRAAWLTIAVHTSLEAVGLTAALSTALGEAGIACNVLAGHHHDHLLVPADRADDAIAAIERLSGQDR